MSENVDREAVHSLLCGACRTEEEDPAIPFSSLTTLCHPSLKHRFTLLFLSTSDLYALLDVAKVCVLAHTHVLSPSFVYYYLPQREGLLYTPFWKCISFGVIYSFYDLTILLHCP